MFAHRLHVLVFLTAGNFCLVLVLTACREIGSTDLVEHEQTWHRRIHGLEVAL